MKELLVFKQTNEAKNILLVQDGETAELASIFRTTSYISPSQYQFGSDVLSATACLSKNKEPEDARLSGFLNNEITARRGI